MSLDLSGRIAVVTGASRGIGRAAALELARAGAHIVAFARTQGALEELDDEIRALGGQATLTPCDIRDFDALDRLGRAIYDRWGRLDILVGAAGALGPITPVGHVEPKEWDSVFAVNVTANWRLIRSFDMLLRASDAGRVVFVTSGVAHAAATRPYWTAYGASKAALESLARSYAVETMNITPVRVMLVNPGPLRTRMRAQAMPGEDPMTLRTPEELAPKIAALCAPGSTETGRLYDFPQDRVLSFRAPD
ncbi:SDR family NAD(P)-dependent oxidoreductase [Methylocella sp.]|uniref:SDR family NAD(P)-dependent oxidoreductase n=1 Tax=Methylocella sp. TaxID=1978226 RepID=UPI003784A7D4